ncbi:GTP cyclohydrolase I FolE [Actinomadura graeca]|uniref:GTP cyclohydrolase 1 n=1 Tax=Actinomadura graeca TaxID=2750812 RepID=A0ABX8R457_9ACTN|nr:GTP cyclohydrolase I FolE [Actinomadura graeca]QXJ25861.1 GTP cyclohydrolase I FolE [Actinomadura graeca]
MDGPSENGDAIVGGSIVEGLEYRAGATETVSHELLPAEDPLEPRKRSFDHHMIETGVTMILEGLGLDPDHPRIKDTPTRYARMCDEVFSGLLSDGREAMNRFFDENHNEVVIVRNIPFASVCEHHLVPFIGEAHIAYLPHPDGFITGLSKIARLVDVMARRPSLQERMTREIAEKIEEVLRPQGVLVVVDAEHLCMTMRGVRKPGSVTVTSAARGKMQSDPETRREYMGMLRNP